jgi:hypothetical protein
MIPLGILAAQAAPAAGGIVFLDTLTLETASASISIDPLPTGYQSLIFRTYLETTAVDQLDISFSTTPASGAYVFISHSTSVVQGNGNVLSSNYDDNVAYGVPDPFKPYGELMLKDYEENWFKTFAVWSVSGGTNTRFHAGQIHTADTLTSLTLSATGDTFQIGSKIEIYGVLNG